MRLRVLDTGLRPARWNAAMSAALLDSVDEGAPATLRFHRYPVSCVIGRNQDVETELDVATCLAEGVQVARRVTGGGAVVMGPGVLAFDLVMPLSRGEAFALPRRAGEALAGALRGLGLEAVLATPGSIEIDGRKVSGSAGRLGRRAALHQATLILDLAEAAPLALLRRRTEAGRPTPDPRHRVVGLKGMRDTSSSPLAGEGGPAKPGRMRGRDSRSTPALYPSSVSASHCHLLPQGEKVVALQPVILRAFANILSLTPERSEPTGQELARADAILTQTIGRDDFVFTGDVDDRRAA